MGMPPDPVTGLMEMPIAVGIPIAVLLWAATRWFGVLGLLSLPGLLVGILLIDRRPRA